MTGGGGHARRCPCGGWARVVGTWSTHVGRARRYRCGECALRMTLSGVGVEGAWVRPKSGLDAQVSLAVGLARVYRDYVWVPTAVQIADAVTGRDLADTPMTAARVQRWVLRVLGASLPRTSEARLGQGGRLVSRVLAVVRSPQTVRVVADTLGISRIAAWNRLSALRRLGLVERIVCDSLYEHGNAAAWVAVRGGKGHGSED